MIKEKIYQYMFMLTNSTIGIYGAIHVDREWTKYIWKELMEIKVWLMVYASSTQTCVREVSVSQTSYYKKP